MTRSLQSTICSACWRGYIGTWEIKNGRLYLIGLSGNYKLTEGVSIFAEWVSATIIGLEGKILGQVDDGFEGFSSVYEREQHITIENGIVVATIVVDNRPQSPGATQIQNFVESRGIKSLLHFTKVTNVPGILKHGLLGRVSIASRNLNAVFNDQYRHDHAPDAVCASISFPNYKMFYSLQQKNLEEDWVVLRLSPDVPP